MKARQCIRGRTFVGWRLRITGEGTREGIGATALCDTKEELNRQWTVFPGVRKVTRVFKITKQAKALRGLLAAIDKCRSIGGSIAAGVDAAVAEARKVSP